MKVYKAELIMYMDFDKEDEFKTKFSLELDERDYERDLKHKQWLSRCGFACYKIPMDIKVQYTARGLYKAVTGFEQPLTQKEYIDLRKNLASKIIKQLNYDKENYLKQHENKINMLQKIVDK